MKDPVATKNDVLKTEEYFIEVEPCYESVADKIAVFEATYRN